MSKPILVIRFPYPNSEKKQLDLWKEMNNISRQLNDYHVIGLTENNIDAVKFECYNSPHTEVEFKKLKNKLMKSFTKVKL